MQESNTVGCTLNEESIVNEEEISPVVVLLFGDMCVCFSLSLSLFWVVCGTCGMKMRSVTNFFEKCRYLGFQSFFLPFFVFPNDFSQ